MIDPATRWKIEAQIPLGRLGDPSEAAHFAASLLDGGNMYQTGNFFFDPIFPVLRDRHY
jgi:hypothetical protein